MNTRLQVEHPVTEMITGLDLVEWQLRVASGEPLPLRQDEITLDGWAMEARLYAENPATGFLPSTGRLERYRVRSTQHARQDRVVRIDDAVEEGGEVTPFYDPMIAKLIVKAATREQAVRDLAWLCGEVNVWPVKTNAGFLARVAADPAFVVGGIDTGFIERNADLAQKPPPSGDVLAAVAGEMRWPATSPPFLDDWALTGFRLNAEARTTVPLWIDGERHEASVEVSYPVTRFYADALGGGVLFEKGEAYQVEASPPVSGPAGGASDGKLLAPMPGRVVALAVAAGQRVAKGAPVVTLEAMKMEHGLTAPFDAVVAEAPVAVGQQVSEGALLVRLEPVASGA